MAKKRKPRIRRVHDEITIEAIVEIRFTIDPDKPRRGLFGGPPGIREALIEYLSKALVLDVDTEEYGQPDGAVVIGAEINWESAVSRTD
jgi:hypothetical protein